ncbi:hypothetical protein OXYTRIMIC_594 [Oxytricha trifallax]|uniref:Transmembrane protein n=1 Tax=Oxytricha trifallax TaxID=1172189 RepID=A0A073HYQ7_9SPIT|nr:hypothetical protein OXYTRIMIC_594 [Oxytricha trifallax]
MNQEIDSIKRFLGFSISNKIKMRAFMEIIKQNQKSSQIVVCFVCLGFRDQGWKGLSHSFCIFMIFLLVQQNQFAFFVMKSFLYSSFLILLLLCLLVQVKVQGIELLSINSKL